MKKAQRYLLAVALLCTAFVNAQSPLKKVWDNRFGGTDYDYFTNMIATRDSGYLVGGYILSKAGGDITQAKIGKNDFWIVKTDAQGQKQWDRRYGGTKDDNLYAMEQTLDGGYILGGTTLSNDGDVTDTLNGTSDFWLVKIDALGNKQWDRCYGGGKTEAIQALQQTRDKGYILAGTSSSMKGGDKTEDCRNGDPRYPDWWILKIDSTGVVQWDRTMGGTAEEDVTSILQDDDGGYVIAGSTKSDTGYDITIPTWDPQFPDDDYWLAKIDAQGNKLWQQQYGGEGYDDAYSVVKCRATGGYIIGGITSSQSNGNKTLPLIGASPFAFTSDYWLIWTDSVGNKLWEKAYGTDGDETAFGNISPTRDGGFVLTGFHSSGVGFDITEPKPSNQMWFLKIDAVGNKKWDKTIYTRFENFQDGPGKIVEAQNGNYVIASESYAMDTDDITQACRGNNDYVIFEYRDTTLVSPSSCYAHFTLHRDSLRYSTWYLVSHAGGAGPVTYLWNWGDGETSTGAYPSHTYSGYGIYNICLTVSDSAGCVTSYCDNTNYLYKNMDTVRVNVVDKLPDVVVTGITATGSIAPVLQLYPNPANNVLMISTNALQPQYLHIYNLNGQEVREQPYSTQVDISTLIPGMYFIELAGTGTRRRAKFIKL